MAAKRTYQVGSQSPLHLVTTCFSAPKKYRAKYPIICSSFFAMHIYVAMYRGAAQVRPLTHAPQQVIP